MSHDTKGTSVAALLRHTDKTSLEHRVLNLIHAHGALTRQEIAKKLEKPINSVCAPVKSLLKAGILEEVQRVVNAESGNKCWTLGVKAGAE